MAFANADICRRLDPPAAPTNKSSLHPMEQEAHPTETDVGSGREDLPEQASIAKTNNSPAPHLASPRTHVESDDGYYAVAAVVNGSWRIIEASNGWQWILQRRRVSRNDTVRSWQNVSFCRRRQDLERAVRRHCGPTVAPVLSTLPEVYGVRFLCPSSAEAVAESAKGKPRTLPIRFIPADARGTGTREESHDYRSVIALIGDGWRIIKCRDRMQWILQRRSGTRDYQPRWKSLSFCRTRKALERCVRERCHVDDASALRVLPDSCGE